MSLFHPIDLYCERTAPGFWNEPVNAISNIAFLIAALWAFKVWQAQPRRGKLDLALIVLGGFIGVGSFLFHTFANGWAERADVIPIWSFVAAYVLLIIYRMTGENLVRTLRIAGIAGVVTAGSVWVSSGSVTTDADEAVGAFNGSIQYLPALIALTTFAALAFLRNHPARVLVGGAALAFCLSLVFRTVDLDYCAATGGLGTHFLWHVFNGAMVGLLLVALVRHFPPARA